MANISMKFVLLVAVVAVLCSVSSGFRDRYSRPGGSGGGFKYPGTPPFNPGSRGGLPDAYKNVRFRREVALEPTVDATYYPVNDAAQLDEIVRQAREAGDTVYAIDEPEYYHTY
uniref:Putative secreted protein n=1 Tax=Panstrongylus lignarius TaxID=156445 RepID=A0A224Y0P8_9HEMI